MFWGRRLLSLIDAVLRGYPLYLFLQTKKGCRFYPRAGQRLLFYKQQGLPLSSTPISESHRHHLKTENDF